MLEAAELLVDSVVETDEQREHRRVSRMRHISSGVAPALGSERLRECRKVAKGSVLWLCPACRARSNLAPQGRVRYGFSVFGSPRIHALTRSTAPAGRLPRDGRRLRLVHKLALVAALVIGVSSAGGVASARSEAVTQYTLKQTYSTALRYVRVELGFEVVERDPEAAYLLFKYQEPGVTKRIVDAAIEVIETADGVRVIVRIPAMPAFHERLLRDGLLKKLESDYGTPPPKAKPSAPKKAPAPGGKSESDPARDTPQE